MTRLPRIVTAAALIIALAAAGTAIVRAWVHGAAGIGGWTNSDYGPVSPQDRDLLVKVRQAGLWETPVGQQAATRSTTPQVRAVAAQIADEHTELDAIVRDVADELGVLLPAAPSGAQLGWMRTIDRQSGPDYDRVWVQTLRDAHGQVLPAIAETRASTRNALIREFTTTAHEYVARHHELLESTGLVDYQALRTYRVGALAGGVEPVDLVLPALVVAAGMGGAVALGWWAWRRRPRSRGPGGSNPRARPTPHPAPEQVGRHARREDPDDDASTTHPDPRGGRGDGPRGDRGPRSDGDP